VVCKGRSNDHGSHTGTGAASFIRQIVQDDEPGGGYAGGLFEGDVGRLRRQGVFGNGHTLGICAAVGPLITLDRLPEYLIPYSKEPPPVATAVLHVAEPCCSGT